MMLTKVEAVSYLQTGLNIGADYLSSVTGEDRLKLLNQIIAKQHEIPFQSLSLLSISPAERRRPTDSDIKEAVLTKAGGLCYTLNVFLFYLLRALGFEAFLNICRVVSGASNNHVLVLIDNVVTEGDTYLAEAGCCFPTLRAIRLGFAEESPVFCDTYVQYKFVKDGNLIKRMQTGVSSDCKFETFYEFEIGKTTFLNTFDTCFDNLYENTDAMSFHRILVAKKFTKDHCISLVNQKITISCSSGEVSVTELETDQAVQTAAIQYFGELGEHVIRRAVKNLKGNQ